MKILIKIKIDNTFFSVHYSTCIAKKHQIVHFKNRNKNKTTRSLYTHTIIELGSNS